jgi:hypothetical protein
MPTDEELKQPQRFPLTGDGLATQRVIASGPLNGPGSDIGEELALARYNDHQFAQERMDRVEQDSPAWKAAWRELAQTLNRESRSFAAEVDGWSYLNTATAATKLSHEFRYQDPLISQPPEYRQVITDRLSLEPESTERRSQMPDADAERQADTYWESLINRARQTEQNAQAYAAAQRQAAPERAEQLPLETPKMVLTQ